MIIRSTYTLRVWNIYLIRHKFSIQRILNSQRTVRLSDHGQRMIKPIKPKPIKLSTYDYLVTVTYGFCAWEIILRMMVETSKCVHLSERNLTNR